MARKKQNKSFSAQLRQLSDSITSDLRMPSLNDDRLEGFAYHFRIVLPLLDVQGQRVFTKATLDELFDMFDERFGGCMVASSSSAPPLWGIWRPRQQVQAAKDYFTTAEVFSNPIEPTNQFFANLKQILKTAGNIEQQEILIARTECWLM